NGHRVAIVDLDLEAPGLSTVFSQENLVQYGVIDYLLEKKIQDRNWSLRNDILQINDPLLIGNSGGQINLLTAGNVDSNYLEKLARLDFQNLVDHDIPETLKGMLKELEEKSNPLDFILLDSRAGFHDIGGLALTDLSHAAVIFGRQSRQSWTGLTHVIRRL
ncbi:MAG: KGGVGR-motif variant AAA ATPase, partial [Dolichospermum sp.]